MIVLSVVGSGKTMVLTECIIHLIEEHGINPTNLLAITFAKKAVLEIQSRLEKRLNGNGDNAMVCTFHSLGYRILRAEGYPINGFRLPRSKILMIWLTLSKRPKGLIPPHLMER